jgi:hypothetical protein
MPDDPDLWRRNFVQGIELVNAAINDPLPTPESQEAAV